MIRVALVILSLAALSLNAQAASIDHLKAAQTAEKSGNTDEAIQLYSQAIAAGDLAPDDLFAARKGRGTAYIAKSLIADTFQRRDDAKRLRDTAVEDFTAALKIKTDDADLFIARAQTEQLNDQYDQAIADFSAALKLKDSVSTLMQRASSYIGKGDYDRAVVDLTAASTRDAKAEGLEGWEAFNERALAYFLAGRFAEAGDDFSKTLTLGLAAHDGDVLWAPYQAAWLHVARARGGQSDSEELNRFAAKIDLKTWPGTLVAYFLGQVKADQMAPPSSHGAMMGRARDCNLSFFTGEEALSKGNAADATRLLGHAREVCSIHSMHYLIAGVDLKRLGK